MLKHGNFTNSGDALEHSMAALATAMSDTSRMKMLCALMDGRAWTATELSVVADIAASTASAHLSHLVSRNLITYLTQGRHRYYRLAGTDIANLIENIMGVSRRSTTSAKISTPSSLWIARTCYDHLAGEIAVQLYDFMSREDWIGSEGVSITLSGHKKFRELGITFNDKTRRKECCRCLDWSERRFHLGGEAGAALFKYCEQKKWLIRTPGYREVTITSAGKQAFKMFFDLQL